MNAILGYDDAAMTVRVQPGVLLSEPKADAEGKSLRYTPDPGEKTATVGGNAANNAGGPSTVKYGVKQVPDVDQMRMDPETGNLIRDGVPAILNPLDAGKFIAVNTDASAAIFNYCDYGIVGDMDEVCDEMIRAIKEK